MAEPSREAPRLMVPVILDPARARIGLAGRGELFERRLAWLRDGGADPVVFDRAPGTEELSGLQVLWTVGLEAEVSEDLARRARALGVLVNVEDVMHLCDFHTPSVVRRGSLLMTVSTGGRSPGLAARLRRHLEALFPADWTERVEQAAGARRGWRAEGLDGRTTAGLTETMIRDRGWLP
jgi:precorrin-2 dehydrogenase/sirohydrochlorin ferrochelatase